MILIRKLSSLNDIMIFLYFLFFIVFLFDDLILKVSWGVGNSVDNRWWKVIEGFFIQRKGERGGRKEERKREGYLER